MRLWDTTIVRALSDEQAEGHQRVIDRGDLIGWTQIGLPVVVVAELLNGRLRFLRQARQMTPRQLIIAYELLEATLKLISDFPVIPFDDAALHVYRQSGTFPGTMGLEDRQVAAIALAGRHILVTRNVSHFIAVPGLMIENWIDDPG